MTDTVLVTGASSGIGRSLAEHLRDRYHVIAVARRLDRMEEQFGDDDHITPYRLDLSDRDHIESTIGTIRSEHGPILHLINNAGVNVSSPMSRFDPDAFLEAIRVNAIAPMVIVERLLPDMRAAGHGRVINVTSGAPIDCPTGAGPYSASKAALNVFTVTAAEEIAEPDVKLNLMSPGPCKTEMAPDAPLEPSACHPTVDYLLGLGVDGPSGRFFWLGHEVPLFPDLGDLAWEDAEGTDALREVL